MRVRVVERRDVGRAAVVVAARRVGVRARADRAARRGQRERRVRRGRRDQPARPPRLGLGRARLRRRPHTRPRCARATTLRRGNASLACRLQYSLKK